MRESVLGSELMTGFLNPGENPLSAITINSLRDEGYLADGQVVVCGRRKDVLSDTEAELRAAILGIHLEGKPTDGIDTRSVAAAISVTST